MSQSSITELAARIALNTAKVERYYLDRSLPLPSSDQIGPTKSPRPEDFEIEMARQAVILDSNELRILMQGPSEYLTGLCTYVSRESPLFASAWRKRFLPKGLDGEATFAQLAAKSGIVENQSVFELL
ncbi:hypothetical protein Daus18300_004614 [Diaporthe australafricana]|uniref:Uncharacterized protein n=1 Tax=Diaporthe australafricana TaxID=127596 RepID=A0ABR3X6Q4_9PEZI